jgi:GTP-binding protein EngB required for normal cell division
MAVSEEEKAEIKKEVEYLAVREDIKSFVDSVDCEHIIRYMIEDLDQIDDINNTQSMYLFQLISALENALEIYPRIKNV